MMMLMIISLFNVRVIYLFIYLFQLFLFTGKSQMFDYNLIKLIKGSDNSMTRIDLKGKRILEDLY